MLQMIYWLLAIITMLVLLTSAIYTLVNKIIDDRDFKKFKAKQNEMLNNLMKEREEK